MTSNWVVGSIALALLSLSVLVVRSAFLNGGQRSWWYYDSNDACQAFAAHAVSMKLGAPLQSPVWPGATLATPYLYASLFSSSPEEMGPTVAAQLLADSIHFHWAMCAAYGVALLVILYLLTLRLSASTLVAMLVAALVASNAHFIFALCQLRAELPSLTWMLAACLVAVAMSGRSWPVWRPVMFGAACGMAILSKIQILPLLLLPIWFYVSCARTDWLASCGSPRPFVSWKAGERRVPVLVLVPIVIALLATSFAFLHTDAIAGTPRGLDGYPKQTGVLACVGVALAVCVLALINCCVRSMFVRRWSADGLFAMLGGLLALVVVVTPNLLHGGVGTVWKSLNRLCFGMVAYARHGLQGDMDFGVELDLFSGVRSFALFQPGTGLPLLGKQDAAVAIGVLVAGLLLVGALVAKWRALRSGVEAKDANDGVRGPVSDSALAWVAVACFGVALLADATFVRRTPRADGATYWFYHIYTVPIYVLAIACAATFLVRSTMPWVTRVGSAAIPASLLGVVVIGVAAVISVAENPRLQNWRKPEKPASEYAAIAPLIGGIGPEFFKITSCSQAELQAEMIRIEHARSAVPNTK